MIEENKTKQALVELYFTKNRMLSSEIRIECENLYSVFSSFQKINSENGQIIAVTGSRPGEGATTMSILSALATRTDPSNQVLLIDCNLKNPELHSYFEIADQKTGLVELIKQELDFSDVLYQEKNSGFHFIPAGKSVESPSALLNSDKFLSILAQLKKDYRYIILDCAPVLNASETSTLAGHSTGVILVVRSELTRHEVVVSAKQRLVNANANIKGVILNKQKRYIPNFLYKRL